MNVLFLGAGVIGSVHAAALSGRGHAVTLLARGARLAELRQRGLLVEDARTGERRRPPVEVVEAVEPDRPFDLAVAAIRRTQVGAALPVLAALKRVPTVLFMVNTASGPGEMMQALGPERVMMGFPAGGGTVENGVVRWTPVHPLLQKLTLGEVDGGASPRLEALGRVFRDAGFAVEESRHMDAWLKTHVALIVPIAAALYRAGSLASLARDRTELALMLSGVREAFQVLRTLTVPITPARLGLIAALPEAAAVPWARRLLSGTWAELVIARHAFAARDEIGVLAGELAALARMAHHTAPALGRLLAAAIQGEASSRGRRGTART